MKLLTMILVSISSLAFAAGGSGGTMHPNAMTPVQVSDQLSLTRFQVLDSQPASELRVICDDVVEGMRMQAEFDSGKPELMGHMTMHGRVQDFGYLMSDLVCGANLDFGKNCQGTIRAFQGDQSYQFKCQNGISGEVVYHPDSQALMFSCSGPGIDENLVNVEYTGCRTN